MATLEENLSIWLKEQTDVTDLLKDRNAVFTDTPLQNTNPRPFLRIELDQQRVMNHMDGMVPMYQTDISIHCEHTEREEGRELVKQVKDTIAAFKRGTMGDIWIDSLLVEAVTEKQSGLLSGAERANPGFVVEAQIQHTEA